MCGKAVSAQFTKKVLRWNNDNLKKLQLFDGESENVNLLDVHWLGIKQQLMNSEKVTVLYLLIFVSPSEKYSFSEEEFYREIEFEWRQLRKTKDLHCKKKIFFLNCRYDTYFDMCIKLFKYR